MLLDTSTFFCPTKIILGDGCFKQLSNVLDGYSARKVLLVIDPAVAKTDFIVMAQDIIKSTGASAEIFSDIEPDPSDTSVEVALKISNDLGADIIVAIGGGSTIDVAKAVAIVSTNGGRIHNYEGIEQFSIEPLPLIAIPTTAGTGSEVSWSSVITDTQSGLKMSIRHARLNPARVAILDPIALRTVPPHVACHSGIDAFVHAFESYISRNANPFTDALNLHALHLISHNIRPFVANPENDDAALNMLTGSTLAGMTFGQTGTGNVHCMARFVGARYHVSHGLSNALCLPIVARFNLISSPERYANVAKAMGRNIEGLSTLQAAQVAVEEIDQLCEDLEIPTHLSSIGMTAEDIPELAKLCMGAGYNKWNPRTTSQRDFQNLFKKAL